ncbi:MAG TPA: MmgE/PrpD family protein [Xanthobacteraceae bacterium]|nr:MmgE/PrpD family protein [Xanthobacteraceae bacterium]
MDAALPKTSVAEHLANTVVSLDAGKLPAGVRRTCEDLLVDVAGLCVTVRDADYIKASLAGWEDDGPCTAIGHARTMTAAGAAFVNGTAAHGEDFDDTFEGGPVHAGAVIVPAVLAACERHNPDGRAALLGIATGVEIMCRLSMVAPMKAHKAGFHPTAIYGAMGAAAGVGVALGLNKKQIVDALGVVGSMASGIIEYLAEGAWTKRMHAGWAAQSGMRAALLARAGFYGPRTVFEGVHGLFHGFANTLDGNYDEVLGDFGRRWVTETIAFKPYPCGTMTHPYIDCARRLAAKVKASDIKTMVCDVGEGTVHRLWEPLAAKQTPANGYAGKFSSPYCIAAGFVRGNVGLGDFTDEAVRDAAVVVLAQKVSFRIDPQNPYPRAFTGHIKATLNDGSVIEEHQPHFRGGAKEPLTQADIEEKFVLNCRFGGWDEARAKSVIPLLRKLYDGKIDLAPLRG